MGFSQLVVLGLVLACVQLSEVRFLSQDAPTYRRVDVQSPTEVEAEPVAEPESKHSRESAYERQRFQTKYDRRGLKPFSWKYPEDPVDSVSKQPPKFELRQPVVKPNRLAVRCGESTVRVEVSQDLQGSGRLVKPEEITLGGCSAIDVDDLSHVLMFKAELHECGSRLVVRGFAF